MSVSHCSLALSIVAQTAKTVPGISCSPILFRHGCFSSLLSDSKPHPVLQKKGRHWSATPTSRAGETETRRGRRTRGLHRELGVTV